MTKISEKKNAAKPSKGKKKTYKEHCCDSFENLNVASKLWNSIAINGKYQMWSLYHACP